MSIYDAELSGSNYSGASVTLARHGGANPSDVFSAGGSLGAFTEGTVLSLSGIIIGSVTKNSGGSLSLLFNSNATQARVDQTLSSIRYANTSHAPPASAVIDWTFNDGNSGTQGSGGALSTTGSTTVTLVGVNDPPTGSNATITMAANSTYTLQAGDFGFLDAEDGTTLTAVRIDSLPTAGTLRYGGALMSAGLDVTAAELAAGYLTFTPASTASGANYASFQFRVKDSGGAYASSANTLTFGIGSCSNSISISSPSQSASAGGLAGNISVTAFAGCAWAATSNASWITVTSGASGSGNGTVVYAVAANTSNTSTSARTGTLTIAGQTFTVTQAGATALSQADCIFSWAERTYPAYFSPAGVTSATYTTYYYRYYSGTGNYLATSSADSNLYAIGPATGNSLLNVGPVTDFLGVSGCP